MRENSRSFVAVASLFFLGFVFLASAAAFAEGDSPDGKEVFLAMKCNQCHDVSTVGIAAKVTNEKMKGGDLVNLAKDHDAEWVTKFVKKEVDLDGKKHKKEFSGTDEQLKTLVDWLLKQTKS